MAKELLGGLELNRIYQRDCIEGSKLIQDGSVDLILTDLPYGTVEKIGNSENIKHGMKGKTQWDIAIDPQKVFEVASRVLRKNGKLVLFSQEPYTTRLITEAIPSVPFCYRMIWEKDHFANSLIAKKAPVSYYEDVLVFSKYEEDKTGHPLQEYFYTEFKKSGFTIKEICEKLGTTHASHFFTRGKQFRVPNEKYLSELQKLTGNFKITYDDVENAQQEALENNRKNYPSIFNLWEGKKYKSNILRYKKDYDGFHPTQKPVLLLEDLIKTFSNEGDLVVDLTCGSGTTCVAAFRTDRNFIGYETDPKYVEIANKRLDNEGE